MFSIFFETECVPHDWARGLIFPIFKQGDERLPGNYRGITLLSVVAKLYSRVIMRRVSLWCEKQGSISEEQAGFRPERGTIDQEDRMEEQKDTFCVFLDIAKAYDTTWREGVWKRL